MQENLAYEVNYPFIAYYLKSYKEYLNSPFKALYGEATRDMILGKTDLKKITKSLVFEKTLITKQANEIKEILQKSIINKKVFVDTGGFMEVLPNNPRCYFSFNEGKKEPRDDLIEVNFKDEKNINELYQNSFRYMYDIQSNTYEKIDEKIAKVKFLKGKIRKTIASNYGDVHERLADYSKLIYFLLKKCQSLMNEEERQTFNFIFLNTPSLEKIKAINSVEEKIITYIKKIKGS